jgi:tRNA threonylcarbamoyladenosine biosynthesis protein TsaB
VSGPAERVARPLTLALDAATYTGTVAVLAGTEVIAEGEGAMRGEREERLMPTVAETLRAAGASPRDLARVVCGAGPGSFTSLRIAASIAKGIAAAGDLPLQAVSSLWLIVAGARAAPPPGEYLAVLDAMRGEWFGATVVVNADGSVVERGPWALYSPADLERRSAAGGLVVGTGPFGARAPHARGVGRAGREALAAVPLDSWEPDYGRKAEAQVRWEAAHGRALSSS